MIKRDFSTINDENNQRIVNFVTEDIALNEELRYKPAGNTTYSIDGQLVYVWDNGKLWGFDIETASYEKLISYFTDIRVTKRSESLKAHVLKYCMVRFPNETARDRLKLINVIKTISTNDFDIMFSEATNDEAWFGESGIQNMIWKDKNNPINKKDIRIQKKNRDEFKVNRI